MRLWDWLTGIGVRARRPSGRRLRNGAARRRYEDLTRAMLERHGVRVRRWRRAMTGVAWTVQYADGSVGRFIEAPRPRGPVSTAIFLHEIGHHAIGFGTYRLRCLEEYHAWAFAISQMERLGVAITARVCRHAHLSLWYAVQKARRRGLRRLPLELRPYCTLRPWVLPGSRTSSRPSPAGLLERRGCRRVACQPRAGPTRARPGYRMNRFGSESS